MSLRLGIGLAFAGVALASLGWVLGAPGDSMQSSLNAGASARAESSGGDGGAAGPALALPAEAPASRAEQGAQLRVTGPGGETLGGVELQFTRLPSFEVQFQAAAATLQLDPDTVFPEGLLSTWALGYGARARYVLAGTTWRELMGSPVVLDELWLLPVVASAGRRHSLWVQEAMVREGRAKLEGLSIDWSALGQGELAGQVALAADEYLFLQAWSSSEAWPDRRVVAELRKRFERPVLYDAILSRAGEASVDPVVYRIPTGTEEQDEDGWLQLRFRSERRGGWCTEANRPQLVLFDVLRDVPDREEPARLSVFAVWHSELACYRARLPLGSVVLRTTDSAYPMPVDQALPLPIVGNVPVTIRAEVDPLQQVEVVFLEQDARVVQASEELGVAAPPGTRWLLHRDPSARLRMGKGRLGSFTAVLAPGTWHLAWDLGRRGELPDSVPSRMAVEVRVEG